MSDDTPTTEDKVDDTRVMVTMIQRAVRRLEMKIDRVSTRLDEIDHRVEHARTRRGELGTEICEVRQDLLNLRAEKIYGERHAESDLEVDP